MSLREGLWWEIRFAYSHLRESGYGRAVSVAAVPVMLVAAAVDEVRERL